MSQSPDFTKAVGFVLEEEGVLSDAATDPGGLTKYGISKAAYPNLDIANLTKDQAINIYYTDYWLKTFCDTLPFAFAVAVFDCAVNQGEGTAFRCLQGAIGVTVDGDFGPASKKALSASRTNPTVLAFFLALRVQHYVMIKDSNPAEYEEDNKGWFKRLFLCTMAGAE